MCLLSDNIYDYYNVSQGKVTVPNMDDGEEFQLADVSSISMSGSSTLYSTSLHSTPHHITRHFQTTKPNQYQKANRWPPHPSPEQKKKNTANNWQSKHKTKLHILLLSLSLCLFIPQPLIHQQNNTHLRFSVRFCVSL